MADDIDWSAHRGSCRVFYAERRCTCGASPTETTDERRQQVDQVAQWLARRDMQDGILSSWHEDADCLLSGPLAGLLDAQEAVRRVEALLERRGIWPTPIKDEIRRALDAP